MHHRPITIADQRGAIISLSQPAYHGAGPIDYSMCTAAGAERRARDEAARDLDRVEAAHRRAQLEARGLRGSERDAAIAEASRLEEAMRKARKRYETAAEAYGNAQEAYLGF